MAKLSKEEQAALRRLQEKAEAPEPPSVARSLTASINLGNPEEVKLAKRYGFLPADDDDDEQDDTDQGDEEGDETPKRRGYFGDN